MLRKCNIVFVYCRYLDYDVVRMRNNDDIIEFQRSLNGSYEPIVIQPEQAENKTTEKSNENGTIKKRRRRSLFLKKGKPYVNRKISKVKLTIKT